MFEVTVEQTFAAGHALRNYTGKCENVHGHNYRVPGDRAKASSWTHTGMLVDFVEVKKRGACACSTAWTTSSSTTCRPFDVINPSAENIAKYFYDEVKQGLGVREGVRIGEVKIWETDTASATYRNGKQTTRQRAMRGVAPLDPHPAKTLFSVISRVLRGEVVPLLRADRPARRSPKPGKPDAGAAIDAFHRIDVEHSAVCVLRLVLFG